MFESLGTSLWSAADMIVATMEYLEPFAAKTLTMKIYALDSIFNDIGAKVGFGGDMIKYLSFMLLAYPLGYVQARYVPSVTGKHLFSFLMGVFMFQNTFGSQWVHSFIMPMLTYLVVLAFPKSLAKSLVFVLCMGYISFSHIYRIYTDYMGWALDFTGPQMVFVIKCTMFAYNCYDGMVDLPNLEKPCDDKRKAKIHETRIRYGITEMPGLLEYFGYMYNFSTCFAGPAVEFKEYMRIMSHEQFRKKPTNGRDQKIAIPPFNVGAGLLCLLKAIMCMLVYLVGSGYFKIDTILSPAFLDHPLWYRILYTAGLQTCIRCKYYFAWKLAEGACVLAGYGFEGYNEDGTIKGWDGACNMRIRDMEFAANPAECSRAWNKKTQLWLERYVYTRTNGSLLAVYMTSAFWHGFYPGYYLFFLHVAILTPVARMGAATVTPYFAGTSLEPFYNLLVSVCFNFYINYFSLAFTLLGWERTLHAWYALGYASHVATLALFLICQVLPRKRVKKDSKYKE